MATHPNDVVLKAFLRGMLADEAEAEVQAHIESCADCSAAIDRISDEPKAPATLKSLPLGLRRVLDRITYPKIEGFDIERELGRGGMAVVYRARDTASGRIVAMKVPLDRDSPRNLARFRGEAELVRNLSSITSGPGKVVEVYEVGERNGIPFLSMALALGGTLADLLLDRKEEVTRSPHEVARLEAEAAEAVDQLHTAQPSLVHRDIKPANFLLFPCPGAERRGDDYFALRDLSVMLADLGLARDADRLGDTRTADLRGTPAYMAPEQLADGKVVKPTADVYALGVMLYELLTGTRPFRDVTAPALLELMKSEDPSRPRSRNPEVHIPTDLEAICLKCLERKPRLRYQTAGALATDLRQFLEGKKVTAKLPGPIRRAWRWGNRNKPAVVVIGTLVLTTIAAITAAKVAQTQTYLATVREEAAKQQLLLERQATLERQARHDERVFSARRVARSGDWLVAIPIYQKAIDDSFPDAMRLRVERLFGYFAVNDEVSLKREFQTYFLINDQQVRTDLGELAAQIWLIRGVHLLCDFDRQEEGRTAIRRALDARIDLFTPADIAFAEALIETQPRPVIEALKRAVAFDPLHYSAHASLTVALLASGQTKLAIDQAELMQMLFPQSPIPPCVRAVVAVLKGEREEARRHFTDAATRLLIDPAPLLKFADALGDALDEADKIQVSLMGVMTIPPALSVKIGRLVAVSTSATQSIVFSTPTIHLYQRWIKELQDAFFETKRAANPSIREAVFRKLADLRKDSYDAHFIAFMAQNRLAGIGSILNTAAPEIARNSLAELAELSYEAANAPTLMERLPVRYTYRCVGMMADVAYMKFTPGPDQMRYRRLRDNLPRIVADGERWRATREQGISFTIALITASMTSAQLSEWKPDTRTGQSAIRVREEEWYKIGKALLDDWNEQEPENPTLKNLTKKLEDWHNAK